MKTQLIHLDSMLLGGVSFYGDPFCTKGGWDADNEIGKTCNRFIEYVAEHPKRPYSCNKPCFYEVHIYSSETAAKGYFEVFVGEEVNTPELPLSLSAKFFPESDYLKVSLSGQEMVSDWWQSLDADILPSCGLTRSAPFVIQAYDDRFKGMDRIDDSAIDAYIPVKPV